MLRFVVLLLALCAVPAADAVAAPCKRTDAQARFKVERFPDARNGRVLAACDRRTGTRRILARDDGTRRASGGFGVAGRTATWMEIRRRGDEQTATIATVRLPHGTTRREVVGRTSDPAAPVLSLVVGTDGTVAYTTYDDVPPRVGDPQPSVALIVGEHFVGRGPAVVDAFEDGGRTVHWVDLDGRDRYRDLAPLPLRDGCPVRGRFGVVAQLGDVQVSRASYGDTFVGHEAWRVCRHGSRRDPVFAQSGVAVGNGSSLRPTAIEGDVLVMVRRSFDRYGSCTTGEERYQIDTGALVARQPQTEC